MNSGPTPNDSSDFRRQIMAICAVASAGELKAAVAAMAPLPEHRDVRPPEAGLVMVRGRMGGDGAPFNLGEATVSRASVALGTGEVGHGYLLGRDRDRARMAALLDALAQRPNTAHRIASALRPVEARVKAEQAREARQIAATRVNFFTLARGED